MYESKVKLDGTRPIKLAPTRSWRTYLGGRLIDKLHGVQDPKDSHFPEEWMISIVSSRTVGRENDGLNKIDLPGMDITLKEVVDENPELFLGKAHVEKCGNQTGVLVKLIDSAERLIIQTHPDKERAQELFNSMYGKTECWHFVGGRKINGERPYVYVGFKPCVTREQWEELFYKQDVPGMLNCLHKYYIDAGDTFLIEAGTPHAIGAGCLLVEIQEPSDLTIRMEKTSPSGLELEDYLIHQGIGYEKMFDLFNYEGLTWEETLQKWQVMPSTLTESKDGREIELIGYTQTPYFRMTLLEVKNEITIHGGGVFSGLYILSGTAAICIDSDTQTVQKGDQLFVPAQVSSLTIKNTGHGELKVLRLFGPEVG